MADVGQKGPHVGRRQTLILNAEGINRYDGRHVWGGGLPEEMVSIRDNLLVEIGFRPDGSSDQV